DGAAAKGKDDRTGAAVGPGKISPTDADRAAAEWAIAQGGVVRVNGEERERKVAAELPKERFTLTHVNLEGTKVSDAGLTHLKELKALTHLYVSNTKVSDAGLIHLKELKGLTSLGLAILPVSDAGLEPL